MNEYYLFQPGKNLHAVGKNGWQCPSAGSSWVVKCSRQKPSPCKSHQREMNPDGVYHFECECNNQTFAPIDWAPPFSVCAKSAYRMHLGTVWMQLMPSNCSPLAARIIYLYSASTPQTRKVHYVVSKQWALFPINNYSIQWSTSFCIKLSAFSWPRL